MKRSISILLMAALLLTGILPVRTSGQSREGSLITQNRICSDTGETPEVSECQHTFGAWSEAGGGHSRVCSKCGAAESGAHTWNDGTVTVAPTCTTGGTIAYSCTACAAAKTESVEAKGHSFGAWQQVDGSSHKRACTVCGTEETQAHSWDGGRVTVQPTCLNQGEKTYTCGCGATKKETLPLTDHTYGAWTGNENTHSRSCTVCGKVDSGSHNWNGGSVTIPATCKEEGAFVYLCSGCGGALVEVIPRLTTHTYDNACDPDCNVCGAVREVEHKFSAAWSKNFQEHWHACTLCGEKKDVGKHYPGPAATEEEAQICLTCGYVMTPRLNHTHEFQEELSFDETGHWYACEGCEEQGDYESHVYDGPCDPDCNVCGYVTEAAHDYDGTWQYDETGHWAVCTLCGAESVPEAHIPGPEATADKAQFCMVCGSELAPAQEHVHEYPAQWETDETSHWKQCQCGEKSQLAAHSWDEGSENKDGTITYVCQVCRTERAEEAPEPSGAFPWWIVILVGILVLACGAVVLLLFAIKKKPAGKFSR